MKNRYYISASLALLFASTSFAQKDNNLATERVDVETVYKATVNDAFKINDIPNLDDIDNKKKKEIQYNIFSFPVASTFKPNKGAAAQATGDSLRHSFKNYALLSYGNFNTINGEIGVFSPIKNNIYVGGVASHLSTSGGIKNVLPKNNSSKTSLLLRLGEQNEDYNWNLDFDAKHRFQNWYGLPEYVSNYTTEDLSNLDAGHSYTDIGFGGTFENHLGWFEKIDTKINYFQDNFDSKETHFYAIPKFNVSIGDYTIGMRLIADYVNTQFGVSSIQNIHHYKYFNAIAEPSVRFYNEAYNLEIGLGVGYRLGTANDQSSNELIYYPKVKANFNLVKDIAIAYLGIDGGYNQNTYSKLSKENPFVNPGFELRPTWTRFDIFAGMKGKLYHNASYNVRVNFKNESNKNLFVINPILTTTTDRNVYQYGNTFDVLYDNLYTLSGFGALNFDFSDKVTLGVSGEYNLYMPKNLEYVYNMPEAKIGADLHIDFTQKWYAGTKLYYIGQRWERNPQSIIFPFSNFTDLSLKSFVDLNIYLGYKPTEKWTVFANGNNLFNQKYMYWHNYRVQGIQVNVGAMYKFDLKK